MKNKNIARIRLPNDIKPCPFCGSKSLRGWKKYDPKKTKNTKGINRIFNSRTRTCIGRSASITCGGCGIGVNFGWFGNGIKDPDMRKWMVKDWNRRDGDDNNGIGEK